MVLVPSFVLVLSGFGRAVAVPPLMASIDSPPYYALCCGGYVTRSERFVHVALD